MNTDVLVNMESFSMNKIRKSGNTNIFNERKVTSRNKRH